MFDKQVVVAGTKRMQSQNGKIADFLGISCATLRRRVAKRRNERRLGRSRVWLNLEPADKFKVDQAGGQALRDGVRRIGKILYQHIGDGIGAVDEVKDLEGCPDIFKIPEWVVAAAVVFFAIQQQGAEADIDPDIGVDGQVAAVSEVAGNIEWQVTSIQQVQKGLQVFIGGKVVLQEQAKGEEPVGGSPHPAGLVSVLSVGWLRLSSV